MGNRCPRPTCSVAIQRNLTGRRVAVPPDAGRVSVLGVHCYLDSRSVRGIPRSEEVREPRRHSIVVGCFSAERARRAVTVEEGSAVLLSYHWSGDSIKICARLTAIRSGTLSPTARNWHDSSVGHRPAVRRRPERGSWPAAQTERNMSDSCRLLRMFVRQGRQQQHGQPVPGGWATRRPSPVESESRRARLKANFRS